MFLPWKLSAYDLSKEISLGDEAPSEVWERFDRGRAGLVGIGAGPDLSSSTGCDNGVILIFPELLVDPPR